MATLTKHLYFTTSTVIDWVDIFTRANYRHIVVDSLSYCQQVKGLNIYAWALMSNHLHMVVSTEGEQTIGEILRDFKKFTNKKILKTLEEDEHESRRTWMLDRFSFAGANVKRLQITVSGKKATTWRIFIHQNSCDRKLTTSIRIQ